jgi:aminoglycoside phosphotransferase (APT) family kinase protein
MHHNGTIDSQSALIESDSGPTSGQSILPTSFRLLQGLRATLGQILSQESTLSDRARLSLQTADVILNELLLREDRSFMTELFADLRNLACDGAKLIEQPFRSLSEEIEKLPRSVANTAAYDVAGRAVESVLSILARQVEVLRGDERTQYRRFIGRAIDAETRLFTRPPARVVRSSAGAVAEFEANTFEAYLARRFPDRRYKVLSFRELVEGFQKTTILVAAEDRFNQSENMVIRAEKPDVFLRLDAGGVQQEFELVCIVRDHDIPVAEPLWVEENAREMGRRFMVSRRVAGTNPGNPLSPQSLSDKTARAIVHILARIHSTPLTDRVRNSCVGHWLEYPSLRDNTLASIDSWRNQLWMPRTNASVATTRLHNWLVDHVPDEEAPVRLLHVDYGPHNLLVDEQAEVTGVLDWESVRIGDPAEDLSDLLSRFQGKIDRKLAIEWYREAGGDDISEYRLHFFDAFNNMKTLVGPLSAAALFEHQAEAPLRWCVLPLLYGAVSRGVEEKISAVERLINSRQAKS